MGAPGLPFINLYQPFRILLFVFALLHFLSLQGQSPGFTSYFTGSSTDAITSPQGGVCLMGGGRESDEAMRWFLKRADGGDILILRASGSDGYNNYLYQDLGVPVNSVESIVFHDSTAIADPYIRRRIQQAEAIWLAGGNQWNYVRYWRGTGIDDLINEGIRNRNIVIGGTSAGMAVLSSAYFNAANGSVSSSEAISNPYRLEVQVDTLPFLDVPWLQHLITDTHYANRQREGRQLVFMGRAKQDWQLNLRGIAANESIAVCVDPTGVARVYGREHTANQWAYFLQINHAQPGNLPEVCQPDRSFEWNQAGKAVLVYRVPGKPAGDSWFDLSSWQAGFGGSWEYWSVNDGQFHQEPATTPIFSESAADAHILPGTRFLVDNNPAIDNCRLLFAEPAFTQGGWSLYNDRGRLVATGPLQYPETTISRQQLPAGSYWCSVQLPGQPATWRKIYFPKR